MLICWHSTNVDPRHVLTIDPCWCVDCWLYAFQTAIIGQQIRQLYIGLRQQSSQLKSGWCILRQESTNIRIKKNMRQLYLGLGDRGSQPKSGSSEAYYLGKHITWANILLYVWESATIEGRLNLSEQSDDKSLHSYHVIRLGTVITCLVFAQLSRD